eukprot:TRINITY_DN6681_c0_g1_i1.p1 TRINITY_DN6681_c0_g1~~TRINITY_DN6681_c0_g1_i1.p1  ORF type:complete len:176 (-),score=32.08 TRINITY_DN6681_c0_g1_i1:249-776(-)
MQFLTENLNVRMNGGVIKEYKLIGELALVVIPPPHEDSIFRFRIGNVAKLGKIVMNQRWLTTTQEGIYEAKLAASTSRVVVLKYEANVEPENSPLTVLPSWNFDEENDRCDLGIRYKNNTDSSLNSVRFMCGFEKPDDGEFTEGPSSTVESSEPKALWNAKGQKLDVAISTTPRK